MGVPRTLAKGLSKLKEAAELRKLGGNQAERMARAAEQGYDTSRVFYHGTGADVTEFDPLKMGKTDDGWFSKGFYFSPDAKVANQYAADGNPNVLPVYLRAQNPYDWRQEVGQGMRFGTMEERYAKTREIMDKGHDSVDVYDEIVQLGEGEKLSDDVWQAIVSRSLEMGNPVLPRDLVENGLRQGMTSKGEFARYYGDDLANKMPLTRTLRERVVFDPSQVRSVNADFNPANRDSPNLLAGIAGAMPYAAGTAALLAGATGSQEAEAGPLQTLGRAAPYLTSAALGGAAALQSGDAEAGKLDALGRAAPYLATGALGAAMMTPQDTQAYNDYIRDEMEARTAADRFAQMRGSKAGYWEARRQELLDMVSGMGALAGEVADVALRSPTNQAIYGIASMNSDKIWHDADMPLRSLLAGGGVIRDAAQGQNLQTIGQNAQQIVNNPSDMTTYRVGGAVADALSPYTTPEAAAAAGALVHGGIQIASPF